MIVIITTDGRKPLSVPDWISAPPDERAEAFATSVAYAGRYTPSGDKVIHHVEAASVQNFVNTDFVGFIEKVDRDHLVLRDGSLAKGRRAGHATTGLGADETPTIGSKLTQHCSRRNARKHLRLHLPPPHQPRHHHTARMHPQRKLRGSSGKTPAFTFRNSADFSNAPHPTLKQKSTSASNWFCAVSAVTARFTQSTASCKQPSATLPRAARQPPTPDHLRPGMPIPNRQHACTIAVSLQPQPLKPLGQPNPRTTICKPLHFSPLSFLQSTHQTCHLDRR